MADFLHPENDFLQKVITKIEENLADENFGVVDLSENLGMSRSNLLRKVKNLSGLSVSVFIRQVRLYHAREFLRIEELTVSEVSFKVGFNSTSYFTKCYRESFGYPPGEEKSRNQEPYEKDDIRKKLKVWFLVLITILVAGFSVVFLKGESSQDFIVPDKSIAVLPFKNDSNDSSNVYIVNGLMETILNKLQKIEDLEVTSRTTVEKYRGLRKTIPELSKELGVGYFVEGSGQKVGDQILLTIQLIDAKNDRHVWSQQYAREAKDIFVLQMEVAKKIAEQVEVIITPAEQKRIEKIPTENLVAYDYYLKGLDLTKKETEGDMKEAIQYFEKAIEEDEQFALAYAYIGICYYFLDAFHLNKQYGVEVNTHADKALLYDDQAPESLIAKALFYWQDEQYELAAKYFEKVLTVSPNSGWVHNKLSDLYADYIPDTQRYLKYALQGIRVAISDQDSIEASYTFLHLSNALVENGFVKEAEKYAIRSLDYNPNNLFSEYLLIYIGLAQNFDLNRTKEELKATLAKDTMRLDIIQEIAKVCYTMEDYEKAWVFYEKFLHIKHLFDLDVYASEDIKIAFVLDMIGRDEEANVLYEKFLNHAENDKTIYKSLNLCAYYAAKGDVEKGMEYLKEFTNERDYFYWLVLFLDKDPMILRLSGHPEFRETLNKISENFWIQHKETRRILEEEEII